MAVVRFARRLLVAALCGWWISWVATAVVLDVPYAAGGYNEESLVELPPGAAWFIGGSGAFASVAIAVLAGQRALPASSGAVALGALAGVAAAVALTLLTALVLSDWPTRRLAEAVMTWGLFAGVPCGLIAGGVLGGRYGPRK
jgi:hypothetical protein